MSDNNDRKKQDEAAKTTDTEEKAAAIVKSLIKQAGRLNRRHLHDSGITVSN